MSRDSLHPDVVPSLSDKGHDPPIGGFNITDCLNTAIDAVKEQVSQLGNTVFESAAWGMLSRRHNTIAVQSNSQQVFGDSDDHVKLSKDDQSYEPIKLLTWPIVRDSLLALNNFIAITNSSLQVRGLRFGINYGFRGEVGQGRIG
ncbi:MAG: hypothetical protein Q9174_002903 [Haloplaca sp. 1 TL-2023]